MIYLGFIGSLIYAEDIELSSVYTIKPGDQLLITVFGHETELTALVVVRPDGMITYPVVGDIKAAGYTVSKVSDIIGEKLRGIYKDPQVTVQLKESTLGTIYVFGAVLDPGQKKFPRAVSVIEALAAAGRPEESADLSRARVIKKDKVIWVNLEKIWKNNVVDESISIGEFASDELMLEDGDVLIIPYAERINVIGYVYKPGQYFAKSGISLMEALALAGGSLEENADLKHIRIIRKDGSIEIVDIKNIWARNDIPSGGDSSLRRSTEISGYYCMVYPGDSVVVPEKEKIRIVGTVKTQGQFPVDDEISVLEALAMTGVDEESNLKKLVILRSTGEKVKVDASKIWQQGEEITKEKIRPGDTLVVPAKYKVNWNAVSVSLAVFSTIYAILFR